MRVLMVTSSIIIAFVLVQSFTLAIRVFIIDKYFGDN